MTLFVAASRRPPFLLIDEPESNLHPSLQVTYLSELASYATEGVIFATHSIGLARATADQIYTLRRDGERGVEMRPFGASARLTELIGELSYGGYQAMGFEQVLLVEGPTEILAIQQLLRLWHKDHQILVLPLGGSGMITDRGCELAEIKRISRRVAALIDSERDDPEAPLDAGREAFVENCRRLDIPCCVLERRALENYWPDSAVKRVLGQSFSALDEYQRLAEARNGWPKSSNWRIATAVEKDGPRSKALLVRAPSHRQFPCLRHWRSVRLWSVAG
jgi:hypothetical protein